MKGEGGEKRKKGKKFYFAPQRGVTKGGKHLLTSWGRISESIIRNAKKKKKREGGENVI